MIQNKFSTTRLIAVLSLMSISVQLSAQQQVSAQPSVSEQSNSKSKSKLIPGYEQLIEAQSPTNATATVPAIDPWSESPATERLAQQAVVRRTSTEGDETEQKQQEDTIVRFIKAAHKGDSESIALMQKLLDAKTPLNAQASLAEYGTDTYTALMIAIKSDKQAAIDYLLKQTGIDLDVQTKGAGDTALIIASRYGSKPAIEKLLAKAKANAKGLPKDKETEFLNAFLNAKNKAGETAFMVAPSGTPRSNVRKLLADAHADINAIDKSGLTSLMKAALKNDLDALKQLIDLGADLNAQTTEGMTALSHAISKGHKEVIEKLLKAGANPLLKATLRNEEFNALQLAERYHKNEIAEIIKSFIAKAEKRTSHTGKKSSG